MSRKALIGAALLLALCMACATALAATVNYEGGAEKFVFLNDAGGDDLFERFKGVLPGDVLTQRITVRNTSKNAVRIYMRAEPTDAADEAFLSQLLLTVTCQNKTLFDAPADQTAQLTNNALLGTIKQNGSVELAVTLTVPQDMGNAFMGSSGQVVWTFVAEVLPDDGSPQTGDAFQLGIGLLSAAALLLAIALVLLMLRNGRERANEAHPIADSSHQEHQTDETKR